MILCLPASLHALTHMGGFKVCRQAFMKLLGISAARLVRTRKAFKGVDARKWSPLYLCLILFCHTIISESDMNFLDLFHIIYHRIPIWDS